MKQKVIWYRGFEYIHPRKKIPKYIFKPVIVTMTIKEIKNK